MGSKKLQYQQGGVVLVKTIMDRDLASVLESSTFTHGWINQDMQSVSEPVDSTRTGGRARQRAGQTQVVTLPKACTRRFMASIDTVRAVGAVEFRVMCFHVWCFLTFLPCYPLFIMLPYVLHQFITLVTHKYVCSVSSVRQVCIGICVVRPAAAQSPVTLAFQWLELDEDETEEEAKEGRYGGLPGPITREVCLLLCCVLIFFFAHVIVSCACVHGM